jgi:mono/diheme cytochrome c family protein
MKPILAALIAVLLLATAGYLGIRSAAGFSTHEKPSAIETFAARTARNSAIEAAAKDLKNPTKSTPEVLAEAKAHWADHCANCHANNGSGDTEMGRNLYPPAPDMRRPETQQLTDAQLFFIIENGVRLTGMPGWGGPGHNTEDSWKLVHFIRHLPQVTPDEELEMQKMNPKTPAELDEEREEEEFLKGADNHAKPNVPAHHH